MAVGGIKSVSYIFFPPLLNVKKKKKMEVKLFMDLPQLGIKNRAFFIHVRNRARIKGNKSFLIGWNSLHNNSVAIAIKLVA